MANQETYITTVKLNAEEAKNQLSELSKKVDELKSKKEAALKSGDLRLGEDIQKELKKAENALKQFKMQTMSVEDILNNLPSASIAQIQSAIKSLNSQMRNLPTSSEEFKKFNSQLLLCKAALDKTKSSGSEASQVLEHLSAQAKAAAGNFERTQQEAQFLYRIMNNIKGASTNELNAASSILQSKMDNVSPQAATYKAYEDQLKVIKNELDLIHGKQKEVNTLISQYDKEIESAQKDMVTVRRETELVKNTLSHLSSSSVRDIEYSIKIINEQLRGMDRGTAEFKNMTSQAKRLKTELSAIRFEGAAQQSWINRAADWFNKMQGMAIGAVAAITGLSFTVRKCTEDFADMDDEQTNVQKYTNQTKKEVREMNEDFKKIDTRTSREELNKLGEEAGRLGKSATKDIEEFVDGADKIKVSLGDDLGETAVRDIGKLAMMFGEDKTKGLRGAMYATGSAVNDLAQSSSAGAGYIVDFTARVAGIGKQAGMAQTQIMGLGSVLDQNMQQDEMAATAVSLLINKLFQNTSKMAKIAGLDVKEFSKTLRTDANAALLQFLQAMKSKGGFAVLAPMFEDMKLDGQRATSVLSVMADKINDIKEAQTLANKSYQQGTSVLQEFNTQNNSAKAQIEKSKKVFHDLSIELGEKLMPISRYAITTGGTVVKLLSTIISFIFKYRTTLITLTATISALVIIEEADIIKKKAIALWNNIIIASCKKLWAVLLANPYVAVAAAATTLVAIVIDLTRSNDELSQSQKDLNEINDTAAAKAAAEKYNLESLLKTAKDEKKSKEERKKAIKELNEISPAYLGFLSLEIINTKKADDAVRAYTQSILLNAKAQAIRSKMEDLEKQKLDAKKSYDKGDYNSWYDPFITGINTVGNLISKIGNASSTLLQNGSGGGWFEKTSIEQNGYALNSVQAGLNRYQETISSIKDEQADLNKQLQQTTADLIKNNVAFSNNEETTSGGGTYVSEADQKKAEAARKKAETAQRKAEAAALKRKRDADKSIQAETNASLAENAVQYSKGLITYEKYIDETEKITLDGLRKRKLVWGAESNEYKNLLDDELRATDKHDDAKRKLTEKGIERDRVIISNSLETMFNDKNSSMYGDEDKLNEALYQNDLLALQDRLDLYKQGSEERANIQSEIDELEINHKKESEQRNKDLLIRYREEFGREDLALQEKIAINGLENLHKIGFYSEKEYQEMMLNMKLYYASKAAEQTAKLDGPGHKSEKFNTEVDTAINLAKAAAGDAYDPTGKTGTSNPYMGQITNYRNTMTQLNTMYAQDKDNYALYQSAKSKITGAFLTDMASQAQAAFDAVNSIMSAASNYYAAQSQYEQNITTKKYDAEIQKAGENTKKGKKLKEQEEKEIADIKTKYNKKAMDMQIAQAIAQTAINAIAAYGSAMEGVPYPANMVLAPIAAGIALAAGALQVATIKKQQEAEVAGYYEGGFTSGSDYRKKAGIVHQGEFIANHNAVNNPQLAPVFNLLDNAQKMNRVGSLTALDVSRSMGTSGSISQTVVNVPDNSTVLSEIAEQQQRNSEALERLNQIIDGGIYSKVIIDGPNGFDKQYKHYLRLLQNK